MTKVVFIDQARTKSAPDLSSKEITQKEFDQTYAAFAERFRPLTPVKEQWIREAVGASIMRSRLWQLETDLLNRSMQALELAMGSSFREHSAPQRTALAFQEESRTGNLDRLYKQMEEVDKVFHRALRRLLRLQKGAA